ncbi:Crp/Fnr family transcriptional regulator [Streptomyces sp. NPDC059477]|uniref:Crp/Fnr family transcriptional regulator n=1 Tax=Streptomyces sp. NPDC059477 TaxID=3346847 RepID=UPI0036923BA1
MSEDNSFHVTTLRDLVPEKAWVGLTSYPCFTRASDQTLLQQGTEGSHVLALTYGLVKVVRVDRDGRERLLAFRGPGEIVGEMALQHGGPRMADVRSMSTCKVCVIPAGDFRRLVEEHALADRLASLASSRLLEQTEVSDGAVHERLAMALLRLVEVSGSLSFAVTRDELAQHIGVGRGSVTKALARLGPDVVDASQKNRITVIDKDGLKM